MYNGVHRAMAQSITSNYMLCLGIRPYAQLFSKDLKQTIFANKFLGTFTDLIWNYQKSLYLHNSDSLHKKTV